MQQVHVTYHLEDRTWWAESADVEGFTAVAETLPELRALTLEGLQFYLADAAIDLIEDFVIEGAMSESSLRSLVSRTAWYSPPQVVVGSPTAILQPRHGSLLGRELNPA